MRFISEHLEQDADQPFFMYVAYTAAHWPMHALDDDIAKYHGQYDGGYAPIREARNLSAMRELGLDPRRMGRCPRRPRTGSKQEDQAWEARNMEVYAAMVDSMDQGIGRIVATLKQPGQLDNTLIFFLQDNGGCAEGMGRGEPKDRATGRRLDAPSLAPLATDDLQPDMIPKQTRDGFPVRQGTGVMPGPADTYIAYGRGWANVSNTPFREYKHWVHEGGITTPLIAHWPAGIERHGELEAQPGHLIDLMATCVDVAGADYPNGTQRQRHHADGRPQPGAGLPRRGRSTGRRSTGSTKGIAPCVRGSGSSSPKGRREPGSCTTWNWTGRRCTTSRRRTPTAWVNWPTCGRRTPNARTSCPSTPSPRRKRSRRSELPSVTRLPARHRRALGAARSNP